MGMLYVKDSINITIRNVTVRIAGIVFENTHNSFITNSTIISPIMSCFIGLGGIDLEDSDNNIISKNTITTTNWYGISLFMSDSNKLSGNNITTSTTTAQAIKLRQSNYNIISEKITSAAYGGGIFVISGSTNNDITSSSIDTGSTCDLRLGYFNVGNVTVINSTYTSVSFSESTSKLWRYWYLDAYVKNTTNNPVSGATVTAWDKNNNLAFSALTNASGYIPRQIVLEYTQNGTSLCYPPKYANVTMYTNYTINATKPTCTIDSRKVNITQSMNITMTINCP
jgi:parallel beta-helix repeat protein